MPSTSPTNVPTRRPTKEPTSIPTFSPTCLPTIKPSRETFGNLEKDFSALVSAHKADLDAQHSKESSLLANINVLSGEIENYQVQLAGAEQQIIALQSHVGESSSASKALVTISNTVEELRADIASLKEEKQCMVLTPFCDLPEWKEKV